MLIFGLMVVLIYVVCMLSVGGLSCHRAQTNKWQIFRIGTVRYAEGLWRMRRYEPVIAHCTDSEAFPNKFLSDVFSMWGYSKELPVMTRMPFVRMRNGTSVTIWWRAWRNPPDRGSGTVSAYVVYYRRGTETDWKALQQTISKMAAVTGLRQNAVYQLRVAAVHQSGVVGIPSPILVASTCGSMHDVIHFIYFLLWNYFNCSYVAYWC